jgi:hypothetical protein
LAEGEDGGAVGSTAAGQLEHFVVGGRSFVEEMEMGSPGVVGGGEAVGEQRGGHDGVFS